MIHIICIRWGRKFPPEYVNKLFNSIRQNTTQEFKFTCFTDDPRGFIYPEIKTEPIPLFTGDWYSKISLYDKLLYLPDDQIFFFDLDTVVLNNIDNILSYRGDFIIVRDFYRPLGFQSCLMSWRPAAVDHMWTNYTRTYKSRYGDQGWPEEQYPTADIWQDEYPGQIASYKVHIRDKRSRRGEVIDIDKVNILCFHGRPAVHEVPKYWNMYD